MPTYPLTIPSSTGFESFKIRPVYSTSVSKSPDSNAQQAYERPAFEWQADVVTARMTRALAAEWQVFIMQLHGRAGTFLMGDPMAAQPRGTATSALVDGLHAARATSVDVKGLTPGATLLKADQLQIGSFLYMNMDDITADGSGLATIPIESYLLEEVVDEAEVTLVSPKGVWRMMSDDTGWDPDEALAYGFTFSCMTAQ
jgi:hypothetical protein